MNKIIDYDILIKKNTPSLGGIFSYSDLANLMGTSEKSILPKKIRRLQEAGIIRKFVRGIYLAGADVDLFLLSQRLCHDSYISMESVLAKNLVISPIPAFRTSAVKLGRTRQYQAQDFTVEHLGIKKQLFFGFSSKDGINIADSEKALIDCFYYYQKGRNLTFNLYEDINWARIDAAKIRSYLKHFKNPKFVKFFMGVMNHA